MKLTRFTVRVLNTRGVAFITYTNEHNAEFAKEAMAHQCKSPHIFLHNISGQQVS